MRRAACLAVLAAFLAAALPAAAAKRPDDEQRKIDFLLDEVKASGAVFIRNGSEYDAAKAVSHLKQKLFFAGSRVQTARQFVVGVASHSEASGQDYKMRLKDGVTTPVHDWLMERLAEFEKAHGVPPHGTPRPGPEPEKASR